MSDMQKTISIRPMLLDRTIGWQPMYLDLYLLRARKTARQQSFEDKRKQLWSKCTCQEKSGTCWVFRNSEILKHRLNAENNEAHWWFILKSDNIYFWDTNKKGKSHKKLFYITLLDFYDTFPVIRLKPNVYATFRASSHNWRPKILLTSLYKTILHRSNIDPRTRKQ